MLLIFGRYSFAQSPHGEALKIDCAECHSPVDWNVDPKQIKFNHASTGFSLFGQHISTNCISCHSSLVFDLTSPQCFSCHQDIHQNSVGLDCQGCHTADSWMVKDIREIHQESRFPLLGAHLNADCIQCHTNYSNLYFEPLSVDCFSCHQNDYNSAVSPNHIAAGFSTGCQECHSIASINWAAENFNHEFFPLIGGHRIENCFSCHTQGGNFSGLPEDCFACHQEDYQQVQDPNHVVGNFPLDCTQCHTITGWEPANFNHNITQFPLTGAHSIVNCSKCHSQTFAGTPTACVECHQDNFTSTLEPNHIGLGISTDCQTCHSTTAWIPSSFTHSTTGFELIGQHSIAECSSCHEGTTSGLNPECVSCHQEDFNLSTNPDHTALAIPTDCHTCHSPTANWQPASFSIHNNYYQLIGAHAAIANDCITCHTDNYSTTSNTCYGCHQEDYNNTTDPSHISANFQTQCESCHNQSAWTPAAFNHDEQYFPIYSGEHREQWNACSDCHTNPSNFTVFSCIDCHEHNQNDMDDEHQGISGYLYNSQACLACHPSGDEGNAFDHSLSDFPLTGSHTNIECQQCHLQGYTGTSIECFSCHNLSYNNAVNPNHQAAGISTSCQSCHSTIAWIPSSFDHLSAGFELIGQHLSLQCSSCHQGAVSGLDQLCFSCHSDDYNTASNHSSQNFPSACEMCHNFNDWSQVTFNHQNTIFPLTGGHLNVDCSSCHESGFSGTSTVCSECHQTNYNSSTNPNHTALSLSTNCESCHTTNTGWSPALFPVHNNFYELIGAHALIADCFTCHNSNYTSTPGTCYGCHQSNYNSTINPPHLLSGFSQDCESCHSQNAWVPSTFDHDNQFFPIFSGRHREQWDQCSECHTNPSNYSVFSCIDCHEHDQSSTDNDHEGVNGYIYNSEACYDCHPNGEEGDGRLFKVKSIN